MFRTIRDWWYDHGVYVLIAATAVMVVINAIKAVIDVFSGVH